MKFNLILLNLIILIIINISFSIQNDKIFEEVMIEMRDGVSLHTVILKPQRDISPNNDGKYSVIIDRSPYGYNVTEWLSDLFVPLGFIGIGQDLRGEFKSEGNFSIWHSDANDSYDTCTWIIKQNWSNGIIYSIGASADGIASMQMINHDTSPSWLMGQYVIWASSRLGKSAFPQGVYMEWLDRWFERKLPTKIETDRCKAIVREHEGGIDEYWEEIDITGKYDKVNGSSGFYSGWYDLFVTDTLIAFSGYNDESNPNVRSTSRLIIDPLGHCGAYEYFPSNTVLGRSIIPLVEAMETFGKRPLKRHDIKNITFYVMSSNNDEGNKVGNYWTSLEVFPEYKDYNLYAHNNGIASNQKSIISTSKSYIYDPSYPIPTIGGQNLAAEYYNDCLCGPLDQSSIDSRSDMLVFDTKPLDNALAITGPIYATLYVSSDAIDTDFMIRISDVYPNGEAHLIEDGAIRMRWRDGTSKPIYMNKDHIYEIKFPIGNTSYIFASGHSIRYVIQSSNYPRYSINKNNGILLKDIDQGSNITAINTIFFSNDYPTHITLPFVEKHQLPVLHNIKEMLQESYPSIDMDKIISNYPNGIFQ